MVSIRALKMILDKWGTVRVTEENMNYICGGKILDIERILNVKIYAHNNQYLLRRNPNATNRER